MARMEMDCNLKKIGPIFLSFSLDVLENFGYGSFSLRKFRLDVTSWCTISILCGSCSSSQEDLIQLDRYKRTRNNRNKTIERVDKENYCLFYPISTALLSFSCAVEHWKRNFISQHTHM